MHVFLLLHFSLWVRPSHRSFRDKHALGLSHFECSWQPWRTGRRRRDLKPTARQSGLPAAARTRQWSVMLPLSKLPVLM